MRRWGWASLLLTAAVLLGAQDIQYSACVFVTVDISVDDEFNTYQTIITDHLSAEMEAFGYRVLPRAKWAAAMKDRGLGAKDLLNGSNAMDVAQQIEADLAVTGFYRVEDERMFLQIKCYDVAQGAFVTGVLKSGRLNISMYNLISAAVADMLPQIYLLPPPSQEETQVPVKEVTLNASQEEMAIYLGEDQFVGRIQNGELKLSAIPFPVGSIVTVTKQKEGYHDSSELLVLGEENPQFTLKPLHKHTRHATLLNWTNGQIVGFGIGQRYYFRPDQFFIEGEHYFYMQTAFQKDTHPVMHHDIKMLAGTYLFFNPSSRFRIAVSSGLGVILTYFTVPDMPLYTDYYLNVINTVFELNLKQVSVYLRQEMKFALNWGNSMLEYGLLAVSLAQGGWFPPLTLGVMWKW